jgi:hypothetical protein
MMQRLTGWARSPDHCRVCHRRVPSGREMSWPAMILLFFGIWPGFTWIPGGYIHEGCAAILAGQLWEPAFDDGGFPMVKTPQREHPRRRAGSRTRLRGFADRYLCRSVTRRW